MKRWSDPKWRRRAYRDRVARPLWRLLDLRFRPGYAHRVDRVPHRDELPVLLNHRTLLGTGVEVGVKKGGYSERLLRVWKGTLLISVDPWLADTPERYVDRANVPQVRHEEFYQFTCRRLAAFGRRSVIWRMSSTEAAARIAPASLDFVYIDARHDYDSVTEDLHVWFDKVRPGGILAGHDYVDGELPNARFGVKRAVDEFFRARQLPVGATRGQWPFEMFPTWIVAIPAAGHYKASHKSRRE